MGEAVSVKRGQMPYAPGDFAVINKLLWISLLMMVSRMPPELEVLHEWKHILLSDEAISM